MLRARCRSRLDVAVRPPPRRASATRPREYLNTGIAPNSSPATTDTTSVNVSTGRSRADVREAREVTRRQGHQQAQPAEGESQADGAAEHAPG